MLITPQLSLLIAYVVFGIVAAIPLTAQDILTLEDAGPLDLGANALPVDPLGVVATVQLPKGSSRIRMYYQNQKGDIVQHGIEGGPFSTGYTTSVSTIVRANSTRRGTPIAASVSLYQGYPRIHVYYVTPSYRLAEVRWVHSVGSWQGGVGKPCPRCIDAARFVMDQGSQVLYAVQDKDNQNMLRVGFESAGMTGTISEAWTTNYGRTWQIAPVPNKKA